LNDKIEVKTKLRGVIDPFKILYKPPEKTNVVVCIGGRGGSKTYEVSKFIAYQSTVKKKRCVVLRDEKELVRESILNEVLLRFDSANKDGLLSEQFERLDTGIKDRATNEMLVFTKGFRASQLDKKANLKSISNIDIAVVEEAEDIRDVDKFNSFADSIRKESSLIIIILNTPDIGHWVLKRYFNLVQVEDGFYEIIPKELPGFLCIKTSFEDNPYLPEHVVSNYRNYGNPESHLYNPFYYKTAIMGYASSGRKGQVLTKVKPIKLKDYLALPFKEFYGQDFGTASPAGMMGVKFDRDNCWGRELNYKPMPTLEIAKMYCDLKLNGSDRTIADNADDKAWKKLKKGYSRDELPAGMFFKNDKGEEVCKYPALLSGFYVVPCIKGTDSVTYGLDLMNSMNLFAVEESINLWEEINGYVYAQDKNGNYTNDPIDEFNHLIDPWRYVVNDQRGKKRFSITTQ